MRRWLPPLLAATALFAGAAPAAGQEVDASGADGAKRHGRPTITEVATGLNGPFGLAVRGKFMLVAEADTGQITRINRWNGATRPEATGLPAPAGVTFVGKATVVVVTGVPGPPEPGQEIPEGSASVWVGTIGQPKRVLADLLAYELEHNPDGQTQFDPETGEPLDALSNPFAVIEDRTHRGYVLVADAGANAVLRVHRNGTVSTLFVPPLVQTGVCEGRANNHPTETGCDPVPTGLAYGPDGSLYVSTLSAEAEGEGRVYRIDPRTGEVRDVISGLSSPTGVAVDWHGNIYVSELLHGAPPQEGPPPEGFDPSQVGRIVKIDRKGNRSAAAVPTPIGLAYNDGQLYSTAWSVAGQFLQMPDAGQVVNVHPRAFEPIG